MRSFFGKYFLPALALVALVFSVIHVVRAHQTSPTFSCLATRRLNLLSPARYSQTVPTWRG